MQQPKEYYQVQISRLTILLKKHRQRRNGITLTKVFLFLLAIYFIYTFANTGYTPYLIAFIAAIALFIITNIFETKLLKEIQFLHKLEECSRVELEYLAGNFKTSRQARSTKIHLTLTLTISTYSGKIPFSNPSTVRSRPTEERSYGNGCSTR